MRGDGNGRQTAVGPNCKGTRSVMCDGTKPNEGKMKTIGGLFSATTVLAIAVFLAGAHAPVSAQQGSSAQVAIDNDDIGGVVRGPNGPEAGVWVIAETTDLPTKFARIVVTDDQGRYVIPGLPRAR